MKEKLIETVMGKAPELLEKALRVHGMDLEVIEARWALVGKVKDEGGRKYRIIYDIFASKIDLEEAEGDSGL